MTRPRLALPPLLLSLLLLPLASSQDVFCGHLSIYKQQWFSKTATKLSSQRTFDLKECLQQCCNIPNCKGVTFVGVIEDVSDDSNCILVSCPATGCTLNDKNVLTEGILSVFVNRTSEATTLRPAVLPSNDSSEEPTSAAVTSPPVEMQTTPEPWNLLDRFVRSEVVPIWVIGIAIIVVIVCIGLNVGLLGAYLCYRRRRNKRHTAQISGGMKSATLHAFNPTT
uniref:MANEC domain-containing protein n=1 Tax=Steinernema glaseri TaxID=37863 RepID=A0A1I7Y745_9BILA